VENFCSIYDYVIDRLERDLPNYVKYHSVEHTQLVLSNSMLISHYEKIRKDDLFLLKIAALFHDIGFIIDKENHEESSCEIAFESLKSFDIEEKQIKQVSSLIMSTKIPQQPISHLGAILADADLMYLGTDDFTFWSEKLYEEILFHEPNLSRMEWNEIQYNFISKHKFHTEFCRNNFKMKKMKNLECLQKFKSIRTI
jgi:uncharacterized protein